MAIGGLAAVALHRKSRALSFFVNLPVFLSVLCATVRSIARGFSIPALEYELYALLFAVLILNLATHLRKCPTGVLVGGGEVRG